MAGERSSATMQAAGVDALPADAAPAPGGPLDQVRLAPSRGPQAAPAATDAPPSQPGLQSPSQHVDADVEEAIALPPEAPEPSAAPEIPPVVEGSDDDEPDVLPALTLPPADGGVAASEQPVADDPGAPAEDLPPSRAWIRLRFDEYNLGFQGVEIIEYENAETGERVDAINKVPDGDRVFASEQDYETWRAEQESKRAEAERQRQEQQSDEIDEAIL